MKTPVVVAAGAVGLAAIAAYFRAPHVPPGATLSAPSALAERGSARASASPGVVRTVQPGRVVVYVAGEVARPGVYALPSGARVDAAVRAAGGALPAADPLAVNLAEPLADGERVLVPPRGAAADYGNASTGAAGGGPTATVPRVRHRHRLGAGGAAVGPRRARRHHKAPPASPIDLNAADAIQLQQLPGVGPSLAERIVAFREINGAFHSIDELLDVGGMTDRRLDAISSYIVVR
jgi:competence protein ComEA